MVQINLFRERYTNKQTIGTITVRKDGDFVGGFVSLEKSDLNNQRSISCIPIGTYEVEHWNSEKHPNSFHVKNVKDRDYILIHSGTYFTHTEG